jgi:hypothetical protein
MCQVVIKNPDFSAGCADLPDSDYYMYSLQGYAPCFFFDFSATYDITIQLNCMLINSNGVAVPNEISLGYLYRDIVEIPEVNEI